MNEILDTFFLSFGFSSTVWVIIILMIGVFLMLAMTISDTKAENARMKNAYNALKNAKNT